MPHATGDDTPPPSPRQESHPDDIHQILVHLEALRQKVQRVLREHQRHEQQHHQQQVQWPFQDGTLLPRDVLELLFTREALEHFELAAQEGIVLTESPVWIDNRPKLFTALQRWGCIEETTNARGRLGTMYLEEARHYARMLHAENNRLRYLKVLHDEVNRLRVTVDFVWRVLGSPGHHTGPLADHTASHILQTWREGCHPLTPWYFLHLAEVLLHEWNVTIKQPTTLSLLRSEREPLVTPRYVRPGDPDPDIISQEGFDNDDVFREYAESRDFGEDQPTREDAPPRAPEDKHENKLDEPVEVVEEAPRTDDEDFTIVPDDVEDVTFEDVEGDYVLPNVDNLHI